EYFRKCQPEYDFILCDINMPGLNGVEFVRQLRHLGYQTAIYFMSAYRQEDYQQAMRELNVELFISKPVDFEYIRRLLVQGHLRPSNQSPCFINESLT